MKSQIQKTRIIKTFYEYGKIEHIFYIIDNKIFRIRAFSYGGLESEVSTGDIVRWTYDPVSEKCYVSKGVE